MRAVVYDRFAAATDVLRLLDLPGQVPGTGEVCVELAFSEGNPSDVKARAGSRPGITEPPFP